MQARHIVTALAVVAAGVAVAAPADAAKPKPFRGSKTITDYTVDPTGSTTDGNDCSSQVPDSVSAWHDTPVKLKVPALGKLQVDLANTGDWALEIRDPKGNIVGGSDGGGPTDIEGTSVKTKKIGTYQVFACNLGGAPTAKLSWSWKPS